MLSESVRALDEVLRVFLAAVESQAVGRDELEVRGEGVDCRVGIAVQLALYLRRASRTLSDHHTIKRISATSAAGRIQLAPQRAC